MYLWLAGLTALFHASLVLTVVAGTGVVVARVWGRVSRVWWWAYAGAMGGMIASQLLIGDCILTAWEKALRNKDKPGSAYINSFIGHYLPFLPPAVLGVAGPLLVLAAVVTLAVEWRSQRRAKTKPPP